MAAMVSDIGKLYHTPASDWRSGGSSCQRRAPDAHLETEDEQRVQDGVGRHRKQGKAHRRLRVAGRADDAVKTEIQVCDGVAAGDEDHVVPGVGEGAVAGTEETQDRVHPDQSDESEDDARDDVQGDLVGEDLVRHGIVLLAQEDGYHRRGAHTNQGAERRGDVHQREGDGQAGDGQRADIGDMADEDAVHHVVQRRRRHRYDAGNGVLADQLVNGLDAQFCRNGAGHRLRFRNQFHVETEGGVARDEVSGSGAAIAKIVTEGEGGFLAGMHSLETMAETFFHLDG